eukprot:9174228-Lingulodinium_polyedra.AAC.1
MPRKSSARFTSARLTSAIHAPSSCLRSPCQCFWAQQGSEPRRPIQTRCSVGIVTPRSSSA